MTDQQASAPFAVTGRRAVSCGGLRFESSFRAPAGATLRVFGEVDGHDTELLRFDDFVEDPHYHVPAAAEPVAFDAANGVALDWYIAQVRDHLPELLRQGGFDELGSAVDFDAVSRHADDIRAAMEACVPEGYERVPGVGLRRVSA